MPAIIGAFPILRSIYLRERITIVHGHQTTSNLCHNALYHATTMGLTVCFTDHSLFGFADTASIHINKVLEWALRCVDQVICVSNTSRENTVLRALIPPDRVSVIPNATDTMAFTPPERMKYKTWQDVTSKEGVTIVAVTRLVYRKGADLYVDVIPQICKKYPEVKWIIGGDGPRKLQFEQMIEKNGLYDRVKLLGALKHNEVKGVLNQGQIFLNCSLTEAFCIALIEAVSCGLLGVSTKVGGVPEVLPPHMALLADPEPNALIEKLEEAIRQCHHVSPWDFHDKVRQYYSWDWVAERTAKVYDRVVEVPPMALYERLQAYLAMGPVFGLITAAICIIDWLMWCFVDWWMPESEIDVAEDFPVEAYAKNSERLQAIEREMASGQ
eukprot:GILJ01025121.1.p1 GENE.GILJ01025121.1~~GILJ01025121.1.p1  ORF type:complete len:391 (+),score=43.41 GILJ01025121.1:24-1175(+)